MVRIQIIGLVCLMLWFSALQASDLLREERMAAEIEEAILVGEPVWLQAGEQRFFAIHALSELNRTYGGVIILHGRGAHPDWSDVINPLRSELPAHGWQTLSIQLPVAEAGAKDLVYRGLIPEALPRIVAAIDYFDQQGVQNV
ncbi:MAG: alpha/beta hydrolase family protein, partial [Chromatiales bacterium]|nr:alpha/beta hydrolase family protein [Chromatiales bacterium]